MESLSQLEREESIFHKPCQIGSKEAFLRLNQEPSISLLEYKISSIFHQRFSIIIYTANHGHLKNHESYPKTTWNGLKNYSRGAENGVYGSYWSSSLFRDSPSISFFWGCCISLKENGELDYFMIIWVHEKTPGFWRLQWKMWGSLALKRGLHMSDSSVVKLASPWVDSPGKEKK